MGKDYYAILGVKKDATEDDLKKAYRKAAIKWHRQLKFMHTLSEDIRFAELKCESFIV